MLNGCTSACHYRVVHMWWNDSMRSGLRMTESFWDYGKNLWAPRTEEEDARVMCNAEWFAHAFTRTLAHARTTYTHARAQAHKQTNRHTWTHANKHRNTHTKSPCARVIEHKHLKNKDPYPPFRTFSSPFSLPNSIQLAEKHERLV